MPVAAFLQGITGGVQRGLEARQRTMEFLMQSRMREQAAQRAGEAGFQRQMQLMGVQQAGQRRMAGEAATRREEFAGAEFGRRQELQEQQFRLRGEAAEAAEGRKEQQRMRGLEAIFGAPAAPQEGAPIQVAGFPTEERRPGLVAAQKQAVMGNLPAAEAILRRGQIAQETGAAAIPEPVVPGARALPARLRDIPETTEGPEAEQAWGKYLGGWMVKRYSTQNTLSTKKAILKERGVSLAVPGAPFRPVGRGAFPLPSPAQTKDIDTVLAEERAKGPTPSEERAARGDFERLVKQKKRTVAGLGEEAKVAEQRRGAVRQQVEQMRFRRADLIAEGASEEAVQLALREDYLRLMKVQGLTDEQIATRLAPGVERTKITKLMKDYSHIGREAMRAFAGSQIVELERDTGIPREELVPILDSIAILNEAKG
jgi:hypothetical protein